MRGHGMKTVLSIATLMFAMVIILGMSGVVLVEARLGGLDKVHVLDNVTTVETLGTTTQGYMKLTGEAAAAKESCWYIHGAQSKTYSIAGTPTKLWTLELIVNYCGKSGKVTRITSVREYFSHVDPSAEITKDPSHTTNKPSANEWIVRTTATVKVCLPKVGCIGTWQPWIETYLYGNGDRNYQSGY